MKEEVLQQIEKLVQKEGITTTVSEHISFYKSTHNAPKAANIFDLRVVFVLKGKKEVYLGDEKLCYDPQNFLVVPTLTPLVCQGFATPLAPFISLRLNIDKRVMYEVLTAVEKKKVKNARTVFTDRLTTALEGALERLVNELSQEKPSKYLLDLLVKEVFYHIAKSPRANMLHKIFTPNNNDAKVIRILNFLHQHYNEPLEMQTLAKNEGISLASFYTAFKNLTTLAPLQYLKQLRLHKAQAFLPEFSYRVNEVAFYVGYKSVAHFSRDYKRYFGYSPKEEKHKKNLNPIL